jgi:hypothetical protein
MEAQSWDQFPSLFFDYFKMMRIFVMVSCYEFRLHNDFAESFVTRGLSPLPVCVLDN